MPTRNRWRHAPLVIVLGLAAMVSRPLLTNWQIWGHSSTIDYARLLELDHLLRQGYLYPRWCADFYYGYGSPLFNFYAPCGYWMGELFAASGMSILFSLKMAYVLGIFLAAVGMYLFAGKLWGPAGGAVSASMYVLAPYFLLDVFVRASLGELLGFAWIPLILFFVLRGSEGSRPSWIAGAFLTAALIFSHNITGLLFLPALALLILMTCTGSGPPRRLRWGAAASALALGLSAFFWLPALAEKPFVLGNEVLKSGDYWYGAHFLKVGQLFERRWGFGTSAPGDSISLQLGILHWILPAAAAVVLLLRRSLRRPATTWLWLVFAGSIFLTLPVSRLLWERIPLMPFVQFPWRFLLFATIASSALAGAVVAPLEEQRAEWRIAILTPVILAVVLAYGEYSTPRFLMIDTRTREPKVLEKQELAAALQDSTLIVWQDFFTIDTMRHIGMRATILDDFLPIWVARTPTALPAEPYRVLRGDLQMETLREKPNERVYRVRSDTGGTLEFFTFWFLGWTGYVDDAEIDLFPQRPRGCLNAEVPPGEHRLTIRFENTPVRTAGDGISAGSLVIAVVTLVLLRRRSRKGEVDGP